MFPGQSSRYAGMIGKLAAMSLANRELLELASDLLARDLGAHFRADNELAYGCNTDVQIGVFLANHMFLQLLAAQGIRAVGSLGLSLGEWNHLVHIGALPIGDAIRAVAERGKAYDDGPRGAMASIFPVSVEDLQPIVERALPKGLCEIVNLNSPRQQVVSGQSAAVEEAMRLAEDELGVQAVLIEQQVPMHSSLFEPVGRRFRAYLETLPFARPTLPYLPNRLAELIAEPTPAQFVELLSTHVHRPVYWARSIDLVLATRPGVALVEVGPKSVLFNLLDRKWHRDVTKLCCDSAKDTEAHLAEVVARLQS